MTAIEDLIKRVEGLERCVVTLQRLIGEPENMRRLFFCEKCGGPIQCCHCVEADEDDAPSLNSTYVPHGAPGPKEHEALERFLRKHNPL